MLPFRRLSLRKLRRKCKARARELFRCIEVEQNPGIIHISIDDSGGIGVYHHSRALFLRRIEEFEKHRAVKQHRVASMAGMTCDDDGLTRFAIRIEDGREGPSPHSWMVGQVDDRRGGIGGRRTDASLYRRKLT